MSKVILYHNPSCSKSREAVAALKSEGVDLEVIEYLKSPLSEQELLSVLNKLGGDEEAAALVRTKEPAFRDHKFNVDTKASVAKNLAKVPRLMERPLALYNGRAAIGRPLENILAIVRVDGTEVKPADKPSTESTQTAAAEPAAGATPAGAAPPSRGRGKVSAPATDVDAEAAAAINKKASTKLATKPATESKHADAGRVTRSGRTTSK